MWPVCRHDSGHALRRKTANAAIRVPAMIIRRARYVNGSAYGSPYRAPMNPVLQIKTNTSGATCANSGCSEDEAAAVCGVIVVLVLVATVTPQRSARPPCRAVAAGHHGLAGWPVSTRSNVPRQRMRGTAATRYDTGLARLSSMRLPPIHG